MHVLQQLCDSLQQAMDIQLTVHLTACHLCMAVALVGAVLCCLVWKAVHKRHVMILDFAVHKPHER